MSRQSRLVEVKEDLAEFNKLYEIAQRPRIKEILSKQITLLNSEQLKIEKQIQNQKIKIQAQEKSSEQQQHKKQQPANNTANGPSVIYSALTKYSWEDESKKAKIYFSLENIGNECKADQIDVDFKPNSVELRLRGYRKQNLLFAIKQTCAEIIPEQCKYLVKTNLLSITLVKKNSGTWTQLHFKEDKFKSGEKDDFKDPNASIMNMMKKMYEQGDDTMKKTIAQAWTKSRDKQGSDAFKFD